MESGGRVEGRHQQREARVAALRQSMHFAGAPNEEKLYRRTIAEGACVQLSGLKNSAAMNGTIGYVVCLDMKRDRYSVCLEDTPDGNPRTFRLKPENLLMMYVTDPLHGAVTESPVNESPLACAVRCCDVFQVQALLRDKADPNSCTAGSPDGNGCGCSGEPLLLEAIAGGDLNLVALLLGYSADPTAATARANAVAVGGGAGGGAGGNAEAMSLCEIFLNRVAESEEERAVLAALEPGALAQARRFLKLDGPFRQGGKPPAACLELGARGDAGQLLRREATADHSVTLYLADRMRPLLVLAPLRRRPSALVVLLHGLYQSGQMLERLARELSWVVPHALLLMPTAPTRTVWNVGPAWFHYLIADRALEGLEESRLEVLDLLSWQDRVEGIPPERVVLGGFSMGATVASWTALQVPRRLAGLVILCSGGLSEETRDRLPSTAGAEGLPVLHCHGGSDDLVAMEDAYRSTELLQTLGCDVQFSTYDGVGHALSAGMVAEIQVFLADRLPPADLAAGDGEGGG